MSKQFLPGGKSELRTELEELARAKEKTAELCGRIIEEAGTSISLLHRGENSKSRHLVQSLGAKLKELDALVKDKPSLSRVSLVKDAKMEYVEASGFYSLVANGRIPSHRELGVEPDEFLLGLADLIGELRRRCLDAVRKSDYAESERSFEKMEKLYEFVWQFEYPKREVRGLRHKLDVDRRLLDDTRLILAQSHISLSFQKEH